MALLSAIIPAPPASYIRTSFTATASQTTFNVTYTPDFVEVYLNGVLLNTADYTSTNGTSIVLVSGAALNDIVEIFAYNITSITTASTAITATNLAGGAASRIPYQTGAGTTAFIANGNTGEALISVGTSTPVFGVLGVAGGGTGIATLTANNVILGNGTSSPLFVAPGTSANVLTSNGSTWISSASASAATPTALGTVYGAGDTGAYGNSFYGYGSGNGNTASAGNNTALGHSSLYTNASGNWNTAAGFKTLYFNNGVGTDFNTAFGGAAMYYTTTGNSCTAIGYRALFETTTASNAVAVGYQALYNNTTGVRMTAVGYKAGFSHVDSGGNGENTYIGYLAGTLSTGYYNTIIGSRAGDALAAGGNQNTFVGTAAGTYSTPITTGSQNIMIGSQVGASSAAASNQFVIGTTVVSQGDATITIGSPAGKVYNSFGVNATWTQTSDERLKQDINSDTLGLSFINRLRPITYRWKPSNEIDPSLPQYNEVNQRNTNIVIHGLIAQEVKAALDAEGVTTFAGWDMGSDGVQSISREMFISPLIKAIQEQQAIIESLKARLDAANL